MSHPNLSLVRATIVVLVVLSTLLACRVPPLPFQKAYCPTAKIKFTQQNACMNDGSVEFCIPANDPQALAKVRTIAPTIRCGPGRGRAQCTGEETLCFFDTSSVCPTGHASVMPDQGWQTICRLAAQPFIREIVPTWYE